eukprot:PhM_4_TR3561/c0_g1_i1/m.63904
MKRLPTSSFEALVSFNHHTHNTNGTQHIPMPALRRVAEYIRGPVFKHVGSVSGCGGNPDATHINCSGSGNCNQCEKCGAHEFYTCCGLKYSPPGGPPGDEDEYGNECREEFEDVAVHNADLCRTSARERSLLPPHERYPTYHRGPLDAIRPEQ